MRRSKSCNKANKGSKLMKMVSSPLRIVSKARDFYIKSIKKCAGYGGREVVFPTKPTASRLAKSFSSVSCSNSSHGEEFQYCKLMTGKNMKVRMAPDMARMRSYSIGVGKIGRIDEDRPCLFHEEDIDDGMPDLLYPPSRRSHVVRRNYVVYR